MTVILALFAGVVLVFLWAISIYNRLVRLSNLKDEGWSGIDVQLRRRFDLVPNLVETVKGYADHEQGTLQRVTEARAAISQAATPEERIKTENGLTATLRSLFAVAENYPDLKASTGFLSLQKELSSLENDIQLARRYYNGTVREYNVAIQAFPALLIARRLGYHEAAFFATDDESKATPKVASKAFMRGRYLRFYSCLYMLIAVLGVMTFPSFADERITAMNVSAQVHPDSSLTVVEEIHFISEGNRIRRGVIRVFPKGFRRINGKRLRIGFSVKSVFLDDKPAVYNVDYKGRNAEIRIGDPHQILSKGKHVCRLVYRTTRQISYFENHDELYWNVTGNDWVFPIDKASFRVSLPEKASFGAYAAYTGRYGEKGKDFSVMNNVFYTTRTLAPGEGFTVAVGWPKGLVSQPELTFLERYSGLLYRLFVLVTPLWYLFLLKKFVKRPPKGVVIPRFTPPDGLEPGRARFVWKLRNDNRSFCADILYLAVEGLITIQNEKSRVTLRVNTFSQDRLRVYEAMPDRMRNLFRDLFLAPFEPRTEGAVFFMDPQSNTASERLYKLVSRRRSVSVAPYYSRNRILWFIGMLPVVFMAFLMGVEASPPSGDAFLAAAVIILVTLLFFYFKLQVRTVLGQQLLEYINGFMMYLKTAEAHRLEKLYPVVQGQVPLKTPELFEKMLPYAFALGTAKTWADSFAGTLKNDYCPEWYRTSGKVSWNVALLNLESSMIRTAGRAVEVGQPESSSDRGSSSGLGGGGGSGGGGGGGGGRGW